MATRFVQLETQKGASVWLNPDHVFAIEPSRGGALVRVAVVLKDASKLYYLRDDPQIVANKLFTPTEL
jgi:hypothetical protein